MKSLWLTKNRRGRREAPRLSLFPFLAVLICTMGALVLLLLSVTRQARLQAAREASAKDAEKQAKIVSEMELVQWRVDQLKTSRKETAAQLAEARLVLGHIEDHGRRLRAQFADLSEQAKKAAAEGLKPGHFVPPGEDELRQLESQIAEAQQRLAESQKAAAGRPKSYAIVPYDGPNRTRRRPIYIECRSDAVVLQPENIAFDEADFDEPLGPGNPLAAAVRAAREQMLLERSGNPQDDGEPYPLLLVRPDGIPAYECALAAMKSWGSEFGYELINSDWQLKYPPASPSIARAVTQAVELARQEHARLIAAAPSKYGKRPRAGAYRSSLADQGGSGAEQGRGGDGGSPGFYSSKPADRYGQQYVGGGSGAGNGQGGTGAPSGNGSSPRNGSGGGTSHGGFGIGSGDSEADGGSGGPALNADEEFAANNPYQSLPVPGGTGFGAGRGPGGVGTGAAGGANGGGSGIGGGMPGGSGGGVPGAGFPGSPGGTPSGTGGGYAGGAGPGPGSSGNSVSNGSPYGGGSGSGQMSGDGPGGSTTGSPGGNGGTPAVYTPMFGQQGTPGGSQSGMQGVAQPGTQPNGQGTYQANGQPGNQPYGHSNGSAQAAAIARPDGYITGRPNDGNPNAQPSQRPNPTPGVAMVPDTPLLPGEWRPSADMTPPKPDPEEEKKKKKKHPYDNVEPDHSQADWALRNVRSHAAAISRPVHVDCYSDRLVIAPDQQGGEPQVIVFGYDSQRNADRLVTAVWELMDSWGMAGKEMYWRPVLNVYVAPGAEPRMFELARALEGSGLVIERKR